MVVGGGSENAGVAEAEQRNVKTMVYRTWCCREIYGSSDIRVKKKINFILIFGLFLVLSSTEVSKKWKKILNCRLRLIAGLPQTF